MDQENKRRALQVLQEAQWLKQYPARLAEGLVTEGRLVRLNAGEWAQAEGDDRNGLFVIIEGVLHSYCSVLDKRVVMIGSSGAGSVLGHATRYSGGPRLVTAVCAEPSILLEISESALERVAGHSPEIWRAIAGFAYENMRSALRLAVQVISLRPRARIAARLLATAQSHRTDGTLVAKISQELLGEMTGVTRKTVSAHVSAFERDGLIHLGYGFIEVCDVAGLEMIADS